MLVTHGIALFFAVAFALIGAIFKKLFWWLLSLGYVLVLGWFAIVNDWEVLFFVPIVMFGIISVIGLIFSAVSGDLI